MKVVLGDVGRCSGRGGVYRNGDDGVGGDGGDGGEWGVCVSETKVWVGGVNSEGRGGVGSERGERVVGDGLWRVGCGIGS